MKTNVIAALVLAALGTLAAPLALAQSDASQANADYLSQREAIDSPDSIAKAYQHLFEVQAQANENAQPTVGHDYVAARLNIDELERINAVYEQVQAQRTLADNGVHAGEARDYQAERNNIDSLDHINQVLERISQRTAGAGQRTAQL